MSVGRLMIAACRATVVENGEKRRQRRRCRASVAMFQDPHTSGLGLPVTGPEAIFFAPRSNLARPNRP